MGIIDGVELNQESEGFVAIYSSSRTRSDNKDIVSQTEELLIYQGYCYWRCSLFGGDVIKVVLDDKMSGSTMYPVWTLDELETGDISASTLKLIQHLKKLRTGARVISVEDRIKDNGFRKKLI